MIKLLIYDLDGTLIDSKLDIADSVNWMLSRLGHKSLSIDVITSHVGEGVEQLMKSVLKLSSGKEEDLLIQEAAKLYRGRYSEHLIDKTNLYPPVIKVLEHFRLRKQAVLTNKPEHFSHEILKRLHADHYFFKIIGTFSEENVKFSPKSARAMGAQRGGGAFQKKPSPEAVFELMRLAGASAKETIFIGDSSIDIETGKNAGILTVGVTYGFKDRNHVETAGPDFVLNDLGELIQCPAMR